MDVLFLLFSQGAFLNHLVIAQGPQEETESVENFVTLEEPTVQTAFCQMFLISVGKCCHLIFNSLHYYTEISPLHLDVRIHILCTTLYTFPKEPRSRICLMIKSFFSW